MWLIYKYWIEQEINILRSNKAKRQRWEFYLKWLRQETFMPYTNVGPTIKGFVWRTETLNKNPFLFHDHLKFSMRIWIIMRCLMRAITHFRGRRKTFTDRWRLPRSNSRNPATKAAKVHDESPMNRSLSNLRLRSVRLAANRLSYDMATNETARSTGRFNARSKRVIPAPFTSKVQYL